MPCVGGDRRSRETRTKINKNESPKTHNHLPPPYTQPHHGIPLPWPPPPKSQTPPPHPASAHFHDARHAAAPVVHARHDVPPLARAGDSAPDHGRADLDFAVYFAPRIGLGADVGYVAAAGIAADVVVAAAAPPAPGPTYVGGRMRPRECRSLAGEERGRKGVAC